MRLAFVVGSPYEKNGQLPALTSAEIDSQYLARRLALDDIGATVVELPAERGVAERLEQALTDQAAPIESVLVAFVGYAVFSKERGPALLLDGDRLGTFSFVRLRSLLERYSATSCVIAEVLIVGDGAEDLPGVGNAIAQTLTGKLTRGTSGLLAIRRSESSENNEPVLASLVTTALDWLSASGGSDQEISLSTVFEAIQGDERFKSLPATKLVPGDPPFALVRSSTSAIPAKSSTLAGNGSSVSAATTAAAPPAPAAPAVAFPAFPAVPAVASGFAPVASAPLPDAGVSAEALPAAEPAPAAMPSEPPPVTATSATLPAPPGEPGEMEDSIPPPPGDDEFSPESAAAFDSDLPSEAVAAGAEVAPSESKAAPESELPPESSDTPPESSDKPPESSDDQRSTDPKELGETAPAEVAPAVEHAPAELAPPAPPVVSPSIVPLPLPSWPPVKRPGMTPPPPLPGMKGSMTPPPPVAAAPPGMTPPPPVATVQASSDATAAPLPSQPPARSPIPSEAALLFERVPVTVSRNGASNGASDAGADPAPAIATGSAPGGFRPTVAVTPPSERYGDEAPPSDALPSFGGATMAADELLANGDFEAAAQEYEAALVLLDGDDERALSLARLSRALSGLGRTSEAEARYAEAFALAPRHAEVLHTRAEMDDTAGDMNALLLSSEAWLKRVPEQPQAIELLAKAAEATGDVRRGIEAQRKKARHTLSGPERAQAFLDNSLRAETEVGDETLATALALEGLELSPSHLGLLDRARALFERSDRSHELLSYYERAMSQILDPDTAMAVAQRIERLAADPAADPRIAAVALERLIETRPSDVALRYRVAELYTGLGDAPRALTQCRLAARVDPNNAENYRRAHALFEQLQDRDGAWNACAVLEALGEADINESLLAGQHRPEGLLAVRGVVTEADWATLLLHEDEAPELRALGAALGPAVSRVGALHLKDKKRTFEPDPATLQDRDKSTTMLAKTLGWSARLLGLGVPELYVLPDMPATLEIAPLEQPAALAGRPLGSGLALGELAFLWGRQLPRLRPEFRALAFFRSRQELTSFVTAALALSGARGIDTKAFDRDTKRLHSALKRELKGTDLSRLKTAGAKVPVIEIAARVERLVRTAELTGVRVGLLLVGDVQKAADLIRRFPTEGLTRAEDQLGELFQFAISDGYARLRQRLGITV